MQGKGLGGTFNSTTSQITMFAPVNAAFTSNMFQVSALVSQGQAWTREGCHHTDLFLGLSYRQRALLLSNVPLEATPQHPFLGLSHKRRALLLPTVPLEATPQVAAVLRYCLHCLLCVKQC